MKNGYNSVKWHRSVSFRLHMLFITSCILIVVFVVSILYTWLRIRMTEEYTQMAQGVTNLMAVELDADKVDEYIEKNFELEEYNRILKRFYTLKDNYPNILYMYVYRIKPYGADVVFDLDSEFGMDANAPGDIYDLDEPFMEHIDDLVVGNEVPVLMGDTPDGYLITYCKPLFKSDGSYSCHVCVDFSMEKLRRKGIAFSLEVMFFLSTAIILVMVGDSLLIKRRITVPINKLYTALSGFSYETEADKERNIHRLENVHINTRDEIEELHKALVAVMNDSYRYMTSLNIARDDIKNKDELIGEIRKTAYQDALTGSGSKAAYNKRIEELNRDTAENKAELAMVVGDINNLKYINDSFGHKAGDSYITGCCNILREVYNSSDIFRIGGDEFVIILNGGDYIHRKEKYDLANSRFMEEYQRTDKDVWERYSMSLGMAERRNGENVTQVFKRADEAMYEHKNEFKKMYGCGR